MNDCNEDDDGAATAADIPSIIQRALGMQNLQHPSIANNNININHDDVICGLEGYLLPRYLSLRTGNNNHHCYNDSDDNCVPNMLVRAQSEEIQSRKCLSSRIFNDTYMIPSLILCRVV